MRKIWIGIYCLLLISCKAKQIVQDNIQLGYDTDIEEYYSSERYDTDEQYLNFLSSIIIRNQTSFEVDSANKSYIRVNISSTLLGFDPAYFKSQCSKNYNHNVSLFFGQSYINRNWQELLGIVLEEEDRGQLLAIIDSNDSVDILLGFNNLVFGIYFKNQQPSFYNIGYRKTSDYCEENRKTINYFKRENISSCKEVLQLTKVLFYNGNIIKSTKETLIISMENHILTNSSLNFEIAYNIFQDLSCFESQTVGSIIELFIEKSEPIIAINEISYIEIYLDDLSKLMFEIKNERVYTCRFSKLE